jgi:hypothetical protein
MPCHGIHPSGGISDPADGKSEEERVSGWHPCQRMLCSKHRRTNFVGWDRFDQPVVVDANGLIHWNAELRAGGLVPINELTSVLVLNFTTRLSCCTISTPTILGNFWQAT